MDTTEPVSRAEYARAKNVNRATITRWAQANRIVLDADGNVLVAESEEQLAKTADPSKAGVVKRHEVERGQKVMDLAADVPKANSQKPEKHEGYGKRINESARREAALADMAEMDRDKQAQVLTDVAGVVKAMEDFATFSRQKYERIAFDLKLRVAVESDPDKCFQLIIEAVHAASREISATAQAQADLAASTKQ